MSEEVITVEVRVAAGPWIRCVDRLPEYGVEVIGALNMGDEWQSMVTYLIAPRQRDRGVCGITGQPYDPEDIPRQWSNEEGDLPFKQVTHWAEIAYPEEETT